MSQVTALIDSPALYFYTQLPGPVSYKCNFLLLFQLHYHVCCFFETAVVSAIVYKIVALLKACAWPCSNFVKTLKILVKLILNCPRAHTITYTYYLTTKPYLIACEHTQSSGFCFTPPMRTGVMQKPENCQCSQADEGGESSVMIQLTPLPPGEVL